MTLATATIANAQSSPGELAEAALTAIFHDYDAATAERLIAEDYIQHNPAVPTGRAPVLGFIPALADSGIQVTIHRVIEDGDYAVVHSTYANASLFGADELVAFDVFRVEDGVLAEHWDNLAPLAPPNPSGHSQVDGPTAVSNLDETAANKALVTHFIDAILVRGEMGRLGEFFDGDNYIQHNPQIGDGLTGLGAALQALAADGITMVYDNVHLVVAEGNFVFAMSEGSFGGQPTAFFDLFRVANGRIAEHWDVISEIPAEMAHDNGKF